MNIEYCRYMVELYKTGSVNKAAKNLFTSPQNISRVKKKLEKEVHTKLFKRTSKGLVPTESGMIFVEFCNNFLSAYLLTLEKINQTENDTNIQGDVSVKITPYIMQALPNDLWLKFKIQYPHIKLNIIESETVPGYDSLSKAREGLGLFLLDFLSEDYKNLYSEDLMDVRIGLVVNHSHALSDVKKLSTFDLINDKVAMMFYSLTNIEHSDISQLLTPEVISKLNYDLTSNCHFYNQAILSSMYMGLVCLTKYSDTLIHRNNLSVIDLDDASVSYKLGFVFNRPFKNLTECEKLFISFLKKNLL